MRRAPAYGFTLIELLVVMAIFGLIVGLVGGVGVERLESARAQEEWLTVERLATGLAFRAFSEGRAVRLEGDGARLDWQVGEGAPGSLTLQRWFVAPAQRIEIDAHGVATPATLVMTRTGREQRVDLNAWLGDRG